MKVLPTDMPRATKSPTIAAYRGRALFLIQSWDLLKTWRFQSTTQV